MKKKKLIIGQHQLDKINEMTVTANSAATNPSEVGTIADEVKQDFPSDTPVTVPTKNTDASATANYEDLKKNPEIFGNVSAVNVPPTNEHRCLTKKQIEEARISSIKKNGAVYTKKVFENTILK